MRQFNLLRQGRSEIPVLTLEEVKGGSEVNSELYLHFGVEVIGIDQPQNWPREKLKPLWLVCAHLAAAAPSCQERKGLSCRFGNIEPVINLKFSELQETDPCDGSSIFEAIRKTTD